MKYKEIQDLIKLVKENEISELEIEQEDFKIHIRSDIEEKVVAGSPAPQPVVQAPTAAPVQQAQQPAPQSQQAGGEQSQENQDSDLIEIKSPMIGTFYRAPGPDKDPFVSIGDNIKEGQTICMVEAMKLFNEIEAELSGKVVKILVEDATPIQFDQPLFLIDPKG